MWQISRMTKAFFYNRLQIHLTEMFHTVLSYRGLRVLADLFVKVLDSLGNAVSSILRLESVSVVKHLLLCPYLQLYAYLSRMLLTATSFSLLPNLQELKHLSKPQKNDLTLPRKASKE